MAEIFNFVKRYKKRFIAGALALAIFLTSVNFPAIADGVRAMTGLNYTPEIQVAFLNHTGGEQLLRSDGASSSNVWLVRDSAPFYVDFKLEAQYSTGSADKPVLVVHLKQAMLTIFSFMYLSSFF